MATAALNITAILVPNTETTLFTVPAATEYDIPVVRFVNNDSVPHMLTIWNKPSAAAGTNAQLEAKTLTIQAQSTYEHGPMVLPTGRVVSVQADATNVINAVVHGWSIT
jgi:hypothetical protein